VPYVWTVRTTSGRLRCRSCGPRGGGKEIGDPGSAHGEAELEGLKASGATSRKRVGRWSAVAAAVSAVLIACCWLTPAAPAVTIVTGPVAPATKAPGRRL
jgi:hypothetical protein